ncbi:MAG: Cytosol non-specific dipeptidase [Anaerolineales bacterium]|nr:Cytosol non-specific dipeptidase [Anaerolineales bacterium]
MQPTEHILHNFQLVSSIPRGTKYEAGIRQWLEGWAAANRCASRVDAAGNLVVRVPASAGRASDATVILQGHLDMVWQKTPESTHDFTRDPIRLIRDGDWIHADSVTLGADNGAALALMMALAEDEHISHPALELLFTVEEEVGLTGARQLDPTMISGKTLINLDSEEEGVLIVGCAGGGGVTITLPVAWSAQTKNEVCFEILVGGLKGGHSGVDIHKQRANSNKLMARVLDALQRDAPIRLAALKGGTARNAIPREAQAVFFCPREKIARCRAAFAEIVDVIRGERQYAEPALTVTMSEKKDSAQAIGAVETQAAIRLLTALPCGVLKMSEDASGIVETSSNIGVVELKEDGLLIASNHRSCVSARIEEEVRRVESLAGLAGATAERTGLGAPWQPNMDSPLLKKCAAAYRSLNGKAPKVEIIHAGLECGVISERCGGLDCISLGPTIENPHSPDERLYVPSLAETWNLLEAVLQQP